MKERKRERDHFVTLFVNSTGLLAEIDLGSALAMVSVYISENLGSLEEISNPVLVKDPCTATKKRFQQRYQNYKVYHVL